MFNGIIFNKGIVNKIEKRKKVINLFLKSNIKISKKDLGLSISCDGACLTLISCKKNIIEFYLSNETLIKSKFKNVKINDEINLELPLKFGENISGHICQGHVDTVAYINKEDMLTTIIREFNSYLNKYKRIENLIIPVGDGLTICRKL